MTKTELSRFQAVLNAKIIELEQLIRRRDGIRIERTADQLEEIQQASEHALAVCNLDRDSNQLRNVRDVHPSYPRRRLWEVPAV